MRSDANAALWWGSGLLDREPPLIGLARRLKGLCCRFLASPRIEAGSRRRPHLVSMGRLVIAGVDSVRTNVSPILREES